MNFFGRRSVAAIIASLTDMVEQLRAHADQKVAEASEHDAEIERRISLRDEAINEQTKALAAAHKIGELING